jgi:cell cycle sensor histidine kinase DivJ
MEREGPRPSRFAFGWHLAVAVVVVCAMAALWFTPGRPFALPLAAIGAAAALGALLSRLRSPTARATATVLWGLSAIAASLLTGGIGGPLAPWCLAPLAAALAFRRPGLMPLGVAVSVIAAGLAATVSLLLGPSLPAPAVANWLGMLSLVTVAVGLGASLVDLLGRQRGELARREIIARPIVWRWNSDWPPPPPRRRASGRAPAKRRKPPRPPRRPAPASLASWPI